MSYLFYYFISDIVIYLIYIDLMRKRCQLINVDVDVECHQHHHFTSLGNKRLMENSFPVIIAISRISSGSIFLLFSYESSQGHIHNMGKSLAPAS